MFVKEDNVEIALPLPEVLQERFDVEDSVQKLEAR